MSRVVTNTDTATGTNNGTIFGGTYHCKVIPMTWHTTGLQSIVKNTDTSQFYKLDAATSFEVYTAGGSYVQTITAPRYMGHCNDSFYENGNVYVFGVDVGTTNYDPPKIYNVANNTLTDITVNGIVAPSGSVRAGSGICNYNNNEMLLGYIDITEGDPYTISASQKVSIYRIAKTGGTATLVAEFAKISAYIQGMTFVDGVLYLICDNRASSGTSLASTLLAIRGDTWEIIGSLQCNTAFEPEGLDYILQDDKNELTMAGQGNGTNFMRFSIPYSLVEDTTGNVTIKYNGSTIATKQDASLPVSVTYGGGSITTVTSGQKKNLKCNGDVAETDIIVGNVTLKCSGKKMASDVTVEVSSS